MKNRTQDGALTTFAAIFLPVLIAAFFGYAYACVYGWWSIAAIAGIIAAFPLSSLLHELGHMLFGALVKIKCVPKFSILHSSSCKIAPKTDKNLKGRIIFTTLGGVTVNLILAVLGIVAFFVPAVPLWLSAILPASLYLFTLNVMPVTLSDGKTDGLVVLELAKNEDTAKVMLAVLTVQAQILNGKPIEEIEESLLMDLPQIQEDDINFIALTQLRYEYFKAKGDDQSAEKYLKRFESLKEYI